MFLIINLYDELSRFNFNGKQQFELLLLGAFSKLAGKAQRKFSDFFLLTGD